MSRITRLILSDFRNYAALDLSVEAGLTAFTGENGAGKTNLLEAVSLLAPGRGLRRAEFHEIARAAGAGRWAVSIEIESAYGDTQLGTGLDAETQSRLCRINREPVPGPSAFSDYLRLVWITPELDGMFRGPAGGRRRFLDRLVLALDPAHAGRASAFERALRNRNRLLEDQVEDSAWLAAAEREAAELGVAVAAARRETVLRLSELIARRRDSMAPFPHAALALEGDIEARLAIEPASACEDWYRNSLRQNRARDRAAGRALAGPNTSDLSVRHGPKDMPAAQSSTGEQKALLVGLILAQAMLIEEMLGIKPILLLDEIAAHLDINRRQALYQLLADIGCQAWMTGTDTSLFEGLAGGEIRTVSGGAVSRG